MSNGLKDGSVSLEEYNAAIDGFKSSFNGSDAVLDAILAYFYNLSNAAKKTSNEIQELQKTTKQGFGEQIESKLSSGLSILDKIYADIYNKDEFDWSQILNNQDFQDQFSNRNTQCHGRTPFHRRTWHRNYF